MAADPAVSYDGGVPGLPAIKPGKGKKINPKDANVQKYRGHLKEQHQASLGRAGAGAATKTNEYSIALNGYSAILTEEQAAAIATQKDVVSVQADELHQATTDSSPAFLGLTAAGARI